MDRYSHLEVPLKEREPFIYIERCRLDVEDGAIKQFTEKEVQFYPCGNFCCIMFGPGCSITHEVAKILHKTNTLGLFVGEQATRYYNSLGCHSPNSNKKVLNQASLYENKRTEIARIMYSKMFDVDTSDLKGMSIESMRGMEGQNVKGVYKNLSNKYKVRWKNRDFNIANDSERDNINTALNIANTCLYGFCEAIILTYGLAPQIGFIHNVSKNSLALDIADIYKFKLFTPAIFKLCSENPNMGDKDLSFNVRKKVRGVIKKSKLTEKIFKDLDDIFKC